MRSRIGAGKGPVVLEAGMVIVAAGAGAAATVPSAAVLLCSEVPLHG